MSDNVNSVDNEDMKSSELSNDNKTIGKHKMIICNDIESFYIPSSLTFVPYEFNSGTDIVNTIHNRAAYLMAYLYEYFTYEDATKLMDDLCEALNSEINSSIDGEFHATYVKPTNEKFTKDGMDYFINTNCGVDWDSFNKDFLDFILNDECALDNVVDFIFNDNSFVFNNRDYNLDDESIADMFGILGDEDSVCIEGYTII